MSLLFVNDQEMSRIHKKYLNDSSPTDVLAFPPAKGNSRTPQRPFLGEVVVSVDAAKRMGPYYGNLWQDELLLYICHGILHLMGYRDKTARDHKIMFAKQNQILARIIKKWPSKRPKRLS